MANYFTIVTDYGIREMLKAINDETKVSITEFAVGDGGGNGCTPVAGQTGLAREVWRGAIDSCYISADSENLLIVESVIPSNVGGFTIREMGIFDNKGGMIAVCNTPDTQKVRVSDGVVHELNLSMEILLSGTNVVELVVDPNVVTATKKDLEILQAGVAANFTTVNAAIEQVQTNVTTKVTEINNAITQVQNSVTSGLEEVSNTISEVQNSASPENMIATTTTAGTVKPDGDTITIDANGVIRCEGVKSNALYLPRALASYEGKDLGKTYTPAQFKEKVKRGDFSGLDLGDYFDITLTTNEKMRYVISGFNTYLNFGDSPVLTEPHVIMTPVDCMAAAKQMKTSNDNTGGYAGSLMPAYLETVLATFPTAWKNIMRAIRRLENNKGTWAWATRTLFLPSETEIHGAQVWSDGYDGGTRPLPLYQFSTRYRIKGLGFGTSANGQRASWWLASPCAGFTTDFCCVSLGGYSCHNGASNSLGVAPGFCV